MNYKEIKIPNIDVNDDKVTIEFIRFENGEKINQDDVIFTVSTAKAVEDFYCEFAGYIVYLVEDGDDLKMGDTAALVFEDKESALKKVEKVKKEIKNKTMIRASNKALKYAKEINFDINKINKDGIIKVKDIKEYLGREGEI